MAKLINDLPGWGQFIIAVITMMVIGLTAYGDVKADIQLLQQKDQFIDQNILDIKVMLKEELERHHPSFRNGVTPPYDELFNQPPSRKK